MKNLLAYMSIVLLGCHASISANVCQKDTVLFYSNKKLNMEIWTDKDGQEYTRFRYSGLTATRDAGHPELPHQHVILCIPANAENISLQVDKSKTIQYALSSKIYPIQWTKTTSPSRKIVDFAACDSASYASKNGFPNEIAFITDVSGQVDGKMQVGIDVFPIKYFPTDSKCELYCDISLSVKYELAATPKQHTRGKKSCPIDLPLYEYCIITSRDLEKAFNRLKGWIKQKGIDAGVVCVEDILDTPNMMGDSVSNLNDASGKIRQYLQYGYKYGGTRYVLFGGDDSVLPIRYGTGYYDPWSDFPTNHVPTDFYFAELNSNWNVDGDTLLGEKHSNMDYKAELAVGRILCSSSQEVYNYTDKLLLYECNPGRGDFSYLQKALLSQTDGMQELNEANIIARGLSDMFPDTTIISELPNYYDDNPTFPSGIDMIQEMNKKYGYVTWINHGEPPFVVTKSADYGYYYKSAVTSIDTFRSSMIEEDNICGIDRLTNKNYPMVAYGISCYIASFDNFKKEMFGNYLNFARSFTTGKDYGGPALIGNTRVGFEEFTYLVQQCFNKYIAKHNIGESLNLAKLHNEDNDGRHHHSLTINIIGCPDLNIWTAVPKKQMATVEYEQGHMIVTSRDCSDSTNISICPLVKNGKPYVVPSNFHDGAMSIAGAENCLVTLTGRNCLPWILPLNLQNTTVSGTNYIQSTDVSAGSDIRNGEQGEVVFEVGSITELEKTGSLTLHRNVTIEKGARFMVTQSTLRK